MSLVLHLIGFGGMVLAFALSVAPLKAVLEARKTGSLGGLDTRNWTLFFFCNMMWTLYSMEIRDIWLFLSSIVPMCAWLWFCVTGVELLSQEEGELAPAVSRASTNLPHDGPPADWLQDFEEVHNMSAIYRKQAIKSLRGKVAVGMLVGALLSFFLSPRSMTGLEFLDDVFTPSIRLVIFSILTALSSLVCWVVPVLRMGSIIKRKDASSVFLPITIAQIVMTAAWGGYGFLIADWACIIPNVVGVICGTAFVLLRLIYGDGVTSETTVQVIDVAMSDGYVSETPSSSTLSIPRMPSSKQYSKQFTNESLKSGHKMKRAESSVSSTCMSDNDSSCGGGDNWTVTGSPLQSPRPTSLSGSSTGKSFGGIVCNGSPTEGTINVQADLPDLSQRLKDCGVYEDYLKWQQGYRRWRSGSAQGAQGEVGNVGKPKTSTTSNHHHHHQPAAPALPCMPEGDDVMEEEV